MPVRRKYQHLLNRDGRYFARLVVPADVRPYLENKHELRTALGADFRIAIGKLPGAVANLQDQIAAAGALMTQATGRKIDVARYPLSPAKMAQLHYAQQVQLDSDLRDLNSVWATTGIDDTYVNDIRAGLSGKLNDDALESVVGATIETFRRRGNTDAKKGTLEWRILGQHLCAAEFEALSRVAERDEGDFSGKPTHPAIAVDLPDIVEPLSLTGLFELYLTEREAGGGARATRRRWTPVFADLRKFIGHDDAHRLTADNLVDWKGSLLSRLSPKTISAVYLASVRTVLKWSVENRKLDSNVAANVRLKADKKPRTREKGFTSAEAERILAAASNYSPAKDSRESAHITLAKRWVPPLLAYCGARVVEVTQLRKQDFRYVGDIAVVRINPEAGSVKTNDYRDVPIHKHLIELGHRLITA